MSNLYLILTLIVLAVFAGWFRGCAHTGERGIGEAGGLGLLAVGALWRFEIFGNNRLG